MTHAITPKSLLDTDIVEAFFQQGKDVHVITREFHRPQFPDYNRPTLWTIQVVTRNREEWTAHHHQTPQVFRRTDRDRYECPVPASYEQD